MMLVANYDLEIDKAVDAINKHKAERVLLHMPDGVKPKAAEIMKILRKKADHDFEVITWAGSCFGACDLPVEAENVGVDLLIHWGHSRWKVTKDPKKHKF